MFFFCLNCMCVSVFVIVCGAYIGKRIKQLDLHLCGRHSIPLCAHFTNRDLWYKHVVASETVVQLNPFGVIHYWNATSQPKLDEWQALEISFVSFLSWKLFRKYTYISWRNDHTAVSSELENMLLFHLFFIRIPYVHMHAFHVIRCSNSPNKPKTCFIIIYFRIFVFVFVFVLVFMS